MLSRLPSAEVGRQVGREVGRQAGRQAGRLGRADGIESEERLTMRMIFAIPASTPFFRIGGIYTVLCIWSRILHQALRYGTVDVLVRYTTSTAPS
jgi:hypothetical protein